MYSLIGRPLVPFVSAVMGEKKLLIIRIIIIGKTIQIVIKNGYGEK